MPLVMGDHSKKLHFMPSLSVPFSSGDGGDVSGAKGWINLSPGSISRARARARARAIPPMISEREPGTRLKAGWNLSCKGRR